MPLSDSVRAAQCRHRDTHLLEETRRRGDVRNGGAADSAGASKVELRHGGVIVTLARIHGVACLLFTRSSPLGEPRASTSTGEELSFAHVVSSASRPSGSQRKP